jgi:hypothetical protein
MAVVIPRLAAGAMDGPRVRVVVVVDRVRVAMDGPITGPAFILARAVRVASITLPRVEDAEHIHMPLTFDPDVYSVM